MPGWARPRGRGSRQLCTLAGARPSHWEGRGTWPVGPGLLPHPSSSSLPLIHLDQQGPEQLPTSLQAAAASLQRL